MMMRFAAFLLCCATATTTANVNVPATLHGDAVAAEFDGHGGLSAGATTRLLYDYPEQQRSEVLDYLFLPNFAASLAVLKLEIGGDTQSTDGAEPSHSHFRGDLNCNRGYEGWLAKEAKARNPDIKIWSLSWGVPGWIGNGSYFSDDNVDYQVQWLKCLRDEHGVDSDYLGLWNERPQGTPEYVEQLRHTLDKEGFEHVGITVEATWQEMIDKVLTDPVFNASVVAASKHYPCNETSEPAIQAHKKFWAGEDTPTNSGNWTAASCWGRKLSQHWLKMYATSAVSWAVVWSTYRGASGANSMFYGNALMNAAEPWSGHYDVSPHIWINAHWHQFASPGWFFLKNGTDGGSSMLPMGGSYVTLVPPPGSTEYPEGTFTTIVETLRGSCGTQGKCNVDYGNDATQTIEFTLTGGLERASSLYLWCSSEEEQFVKAEVARVRDVVTIKMVPDIICTITSLSNGTKGQHAQPPPSAPFPTHHTDDFSTVAEDTLAWGFADMYGSFAVRNTSMWSKDKTRGNAMTQVATALPTGWAPTNFDPLTFIGNPEWTDVSVSFQAFVNHTEPDHYVRFCGGCGSTSDRVIQYGCSSSCCFNITSTGEWNIGQSANGTMTNFEDTWHDISVQILGGTVTASVDGHRVAEAADSCKVPGMVALGCASYHMCAFQSFEITGHP